ncbi:MAG: hypothetical protein IT208_14865 [Chthonomonadales bacterium]|nr:hypothetical protein [Chthonomonadales bacterium]
MALPITVSPFYIDARNEITRPAHFVPTSQYFVDKWMPRLGPTGTCIVLFLRRRGYLNMKTGERRESFVVSQKEIADACACSIATLRRELTTGEALGEFVTVEAQYERNARGHVRQRENVYHIAMDDPLVPEDVPLLEALIAWREQEEGRRKSGRKAIHRLPAQNERVGLDVVAQNERVGAHLLAQNERTPSQNERLYKEVEIPLDTKDNNIEVTPRVEAEPRPSPEVVASLVQSLCERGMTRAVAEHLSATFPEERVRRQVEMLAYRAPQDPGAVLAASIREDWAPPAGYAAARRREEDRTARAEQERVAAEDARGREGDFAAAWERLTEEERRRVEEEAIAELGSESAFWAKRLAENRGGKMVRAALQARVARIVAARYGEGATQPSLGLGEG